MPSKMLIKLQIVVSGLLPALCLANATVSKIAFGSCANQEDEQIIWQSVNQAQPEVFIFLGDNVYGDTKKEAVLKEKYARLGNKPGFKQLKSNSRVIATWDDHDYGENDAGTEYSMKQASRKIMLDFWGEAENSPRRTQDGGIYTAHYFGEGQTRLQILLLDLRWNRGPLEKTSKLEQIKRHANNQGPYLPTQNTSSEFLGEDQWQWLESELKKPASVRIIGSSVQMLSEGTGWEAWSNFPHELERFYNLVREHRVEGLFIISGDTHWAEISEVSSNLPYPLYDFTSSGLTETWPKISPNSNRASQAISQANFGLIEIDWQAKPVSISVNIKGIDSKDLLAKKLTLDQLEIK